MSPDAPAATLGASTVVPPAQDPFETPLDLVAHDLTGAPGPHVPSEPQDAPDPGPAPQDPHAVWSRVLDELAAMSADAGPDAGGDVMGRLVRWTPPTDLGRLPADLVDRALEVLAGHAHVVEHLHEAVAENRRHVRAVSAVPTVHDAPAAAYLDVQA